MKKNAIIVFVVCCLSLFAFFGIRKFYFKQTITHQTKGHSSDNDWLFEGNSKKRPVAYSFIEAAANPERYDKKYVCLTGYYAYCNGRSRLFFNKESADIGMTMNSFVLIPKAVTDSEKYYHHYVLVFGDFEMNSDRRKEETIGFLHHENYFVVLPFPTK